jgi:hypothetical protein
MICMFLWHNGLIPRTSLDGPHLMVDLIKRKRHVEGFGGGG